MLDILYELVYHHTFLLLMVITEGVMLIYSFKKFNGDVFSPSVLTLALFFLSTICFIYNIPRWIVIFTYKAYFLFTFSFLIMIGIESYYFKRKKKEVVGVLQYNRIVIKHENLIFAILVLCSFIYIYRVYRSGMSLGATSLLMTIGTNKEEGDYDTLSRLLFNIVRFTSYAYSVALFYNIFACNENVRKNLKIIIVLFLSILSAFFSGQRGVVIGQVVAYLVAAKICLQYKPRLEFDKVMIRFRKRLVFISAGILVLFFISASAVKGRENERTFVDYMTYYLGSTTALMGRIVENPNICHTPFKGYFGEKTFMGFWDYMHKSGYVSSAPCAVEWINMGDRNNPSSAGNEFTFFCGPYIDFGFLGTLIFIAIFYWMYSYLYYKKIYGKKMSSDLIAKISIYLFLYGMVSLAFYLDTIRSYSRPINLLYLIYMFCVSKCFFKIPRKIGG